MRFVARQPWGRPDEREVDIRQAIGKVCIDPEIHGSERYLPGSGLWLRRCRAAQFVIVYAYLRPKDPSSPGVVSIRAVRHIRERSVFDGVRERQSEWPVQR